MFLEFTNRIQYWVHLHSLPLIPHIFSVDGELIRAALEQKIFLKDELPHLLQNNAYMGIFFPNFSIQTRSVVSTCIFVGIKEKGEDYSGAALFAKRLQRIPCGHEQSIDASECFLSIFREGTG